MSEIGVTMYPNPKEYFRATRDSWLVVDILNDIEDEDTQIRISIALEVSAQRYIEENHKRKWSEVPNNQYLLFHVLIKVLKENPNKAPQGDFNLENHDFIFMSDELSSLYEEITQLLSIHPRKRKEHTKDKLIDLVVEQILTNFKKSQDEN